MCGLTGFWGAPDAGRDDLLAVARGMADVLAHRGPDGHGVWADERAGIAFGHRRLAVIDLTREGHQPMSTEDGRFQLVFNGEVYNFEELRVELQSAGVRFRGRSDTEVVLQALARWGVEAAVTRFQGMFAFALWDARSRELVLVRDRLGIKPLYYGWTANGTLVFASELKAIHRHPDFRPVIDPDALALYFRHAYVPAPYAILRGLRKLSPGCCITFRAPDERPAERPYWDALEAARAGNASPLSLSADEAVRRVEDALTEAVRARMVADVPVGAFLSGGIDSSLVVALMQRVSDQRVKTFTIGFAEDGFDESVYARRVAEHLQTEHSELILSAADAQAVIPRIPEVWDEPFGDSSEIPTYLVSQLAAEQVTVCLSGDGGDELFGGYRRYFRSRRLWRFLRRIPRPLRRRAGAAIKRLGPDVWDTLLRPTGSLLSTRLGTTRPGETVHKLADLLTVSGERDFYRNAVSHWKQPEALVHGACEPATVLTENGSVAELREFTERMMALDTVSYLPGDILCKVDRASMAHGLEARVPLLDHRLLELAWRLPANLRIGPRPGKRVLRACLARHVPGELFERPKQGFSVPIGTWLRGPLRPWAEELLTEARLSEGGLLNPEPVRSLWNDHLAGKAKGDHYLWDVLAFQAWRSHWCD